MFPSFLTPYFSPIIVIQIICILHALKMGKRDWLYLLIFLPLIGSVIYVVREVLPGLRTDTLARDAQLTFLPNSRIKELERTLAIADTDTNRLNLAREYARQKQYAKAIELVQSCLTGIYAQDPGMMLELSKLLYNNNQFTESAELFEKVMKLKNNRLDKPEDELLYARVLDANGSAVKAEEEYLKVIRMHHSMEAMYHYGMLLKKQNRPNEAMEQFKKIQSEKDLHPKHIRRLYTEWIQLSKRELQGN